MTVIRDAPVARIVDPFPGGDSTSYAQRVSDAASRVSEAAASVAQAQAAVASCLAVVAEAQNALAVALAALAEHEASEPPRYKLEEDERGRTRRMRNPAWDTWASQKRSLESQVRSAEAAVETANRALDNAERSLETAKSNLEEAKRRLEAARTAAEQARARQQQQQDQEAMARALAQADEALSLAGSIEIVDNWVSLSPAELRATFDANVSTYNQIAGSRAGLDAIDHRAFFNDEGTRSLLGLEAGNAVILGAIFDEPWAEAAALVEPIDVELLDAAADLIPPALWEQVRALPPAERIAMLQSWEQLGATSFGDMIAEAGHELLGEIPDGAVVWVDGAKYIYDADDDRWTVDGHLVAPPDLGSNALRNAGADWLQSMIGFYQDDVSTGWCGAMAWAAVTGAYLSTIPADTPEYEAALAEMERMGLGMASPERILTVFGSGAAYGIGDDVIQGTFHAWNEQTQGGNWYSQFLGDAQATIPQTALEALATLNAGDVLVMDHKLADWVSDTKSRLADHIIGVEELTILQGYPHLGFFTSFEGNAGTGIVYGPDGTPELRTDNMTPVNKEYMLVPIVEDDGSVASWGAYSVQLPLNIDGREEVFTVSRMVEEGLLQVDANTTPQMIIEQIDAAITLGGFFRDSTGTIPNGLLGVDPGADLTAPTDEVATQILTNLGIYGANETDAYYSQATRLRIAVAGFEARWNETHPEAEPLRVDGVLDQRTWDALVNVAQTGQPSPLHERLGEEDLEPPGDPAFFDKECVAIQGWGPGAGYQSQLRNRITTDILDGQLTFEQTTYEDFLNGQLASLDDAPLSFEQRREQDVGQVEIVQDILIDLGHLEDTGYRGYYGNMTRAAVESFQAQHGLPSTGVVDGATCDALVAAAAAHRLAATGDGP